MKYIYKLIDDKEKADIEKTKSISLSRPLLEFGLPEGLIIDFFRDIYSELKSAKKLGIDIIQIDNQKIRENMQHEKMLKSETEVPSR